MIESHVLCLPVQKLQRWNRICFYKTSCSRHNQLFEVIFIQVCFGSFEEPETAFTYMLIFFSSSIDSAEICLIYDASIRPLCLFGLLSPWKVQLFRLVVHFTLI
jgi:hypothetical protein